VDTRAPTTVLVHVRGPDPGRGARFEIGPSGGSIRGSLAAGAKGVRELWGFVDLPAGTRADTTVALRSADGGTTDLASIRVEPGPQPDPITHPVARVAICLPTYRPDLELLGAQLESVRRQTLTDWRCTVVDDGSPATTVDAVRELCGRDERVAFVAHPDRAGFYRNVERGLNALAPSRFVALCDQDDVWAPHKLERLVSELDSTGAVLAHGDARIVDRDGREWSPTFWNPRPHRPASLARLLVTGSVMGASSVFRRTLLDLALPFPPDVPTTFHDHWLSCTAASIGLVAYVDEPLQDYVQHAGNAFGHAAAVVSSGGLDRRKLRAFRAGGWRGAYFGEWLRIELFARVLAARLPRGQVPRALSHLAAADVRPAGALWLTGRTLRREPSMLGRDLVLLGGLAGRRLARLGLVR
jgi:glycosyltransferase involved in cell wall biosynthesis